MYFTSNIRNFFSYCQTSSARTMASGLMMQEGKDALSVPRIILERVGRRGGANSVTSQACCRSVFSNASELDIASCNEDRDQCIKLRNEEAECIKSIARGSHQIAKVLRGAEECQSDY